MPRKTQNKHKVLLSTKWGDLVVKEARNPVAVGGLTLERFESLMRQSTPFYREYMSTVSGTTTDGFVGTIIV